MTQPYRARYVWCASNRYCWHFLKHNVYNAIFQHIRGWLWVLLMPEKRNKNMPRDIVKFPAHMRFIWPSLILFTWHAALAAQLYQSPTCKKKTLPITVPVKMVWCETFHTTLITETYRSCFLHWYFFEAQSSWPYLIHIPYDFCTFFHTKSYQRLSVWIKRKIFSPNPTYTLLPQSCSISHSSNLGQIKKKRIKGIYPSKTLALCSAGLSTSQRTIFFSHTKSVSANSIFL